MRTEEFLRGYDSCREWLQGILNECKELRANERLMKLAQYPYYQEDGKDWILDCCNCKFRDFNMDYDLCCLLDVNIDKLDGKCEKRKEKVEK